MQEYPLAQIGALWTLEGMGKLTAPAIAAALKSKDPKVAVSALWVSTKLPASEVAALAPALLSFEPQTEEQAVYLARALGPVGNAAVFDRLLVILGKYAKNPYIKAAAFAGLDHHEIAFKQHAGDKLKDKTLLTWLDQGAAAAGKALVSGAGLSGEHLASFNKGKALYSGAAACFGCHGAGGEGVLNLGPPLDESEWVVGNPERLIKLLLHGMTGPVTVAGIEYKPSADMPGLMQNPTLKDSDIADIATYIRHEWSNKAGQIKADVVTRLRKETADRTGSPYTAKELGQ
jgi:mono/diheme cytochrome c family protein